jgi:hypothetical protein
VDCSSGTTELPGGFLIRLAFQVTEDNRRPKSVRQTADFFIQDGTHIAPVQVVVRNRKHPIDSQRRMIRPYGLRLSLERDPVSHFVEPASYCLATHNAGCLPNQNQKSRLEGVFRILFVAQDPPANAPYHARVPPDESFERTVVVALGESVQQIAVG